MIKKLIALFSDSGNSFEGQQPEECVIMLIRRHPFFVSMRLGFFGLAAILPIFVGMAFAPDFLASGTMNLFLALSSVWYILLWLAVFYMLTIYTLDVVVLTNHRLVDNEQHGLFNRKVSELHNTKIQDVTVHIAGFFQTILHFCTLTVQTAGADKEFVFEEVPSAAKVKDIIMQAVHNCGTSHHV